MHTLFPHLPRCQVDSIPVVHGSALFTRGETQSLCTVTVGRKGEQQRTESLLGGEAAKRLFVNYAFPPFAVGETSLGEAQGALPKGLGRAAPLASPHLAVW